MLSSSTPMQQSELPAEDDDLKDLIQEGLAEADRGEFVDDDELARDINSMLTDLERRASEHP